MTGLCLLVVMVASRYLQFDSSTYFEEQRGVYVQRETILALHIVGGMLALLLGPWQFVGGVRARWPRLHRVMGRGYVLGVGAGAVGGLLLAPTAFGGFVSTLGFSCLGLLWAGTTVQAIMAIRRGDVPEHRRWMVMSFSLSFAAVTLRLMLGAIAGLDAAGVAPVSFETAYAAIAWLCWLPNLIIAVLWTRSPTKGSHHEGLDRVQAVLGLVEGDVGR